MKIPGIFGTACAAINCRITKGEHDCAFFQFPTDEERCKLWVIKCRRLDLFAVPPSTISKNYFLCEKHFDFSSTIAGHDLRRNTHSSNHLPLPTMFDFPSIRYQVPNINSEVKDKNDLRIAVLPGGLHFNTLNRVVIMKDGKLFLCGGPLLFPKHLNVSSHSYVVAFDDREAKSTRTPKFCMVFVSNIKVDRIGTGSMSRVELFKICPIYLSKDVYRTKSIILSSDINNNCCENVNIVAHNYSYSSFFEKPLNDLVESILLESDEAEGNQTLPNIIKRKRVMKPSMSVDAAGKNETEFYLASYVGLKEEASLKEIVLPVLLNSKKISFSGVGVSQQKNLPLKKIPTVAEKLKTNIYGKNFNFSVTRSQMKSLSSSDKSVSSKVDSSVTKGNSSNSSNSIKKSARIRNSRYLLSLGSLRKKKENLNSSDIDNNLIDDTDLSQEQMISVSDSEGSLSDDAAEKTHPSNAKKPKDSLSAESRTKRMRNERKQISFLDPKMGNRQERYVILNKSVVKRRILRGPFSSYVSSDGSQIENTVYNPPNEKKYSINLNSIYKEIDNLSITDKLKNKLRATVSAQKGLDQQILARKKFIKIPLAKGRGKITAWHVNKVLQYCLGKNTVKASSSNSGFTCVDDTKDSSEKSLASITAENAIRDHNYGFSIQKMSEKKVKKKNAKNSENSPEGSEASEELKSDAVNTPVENTEASVSIKSECMEVGTSSSGSKPNDIITSENMDLSEALGSPNELDSSGQAKLETYDNQLVEGNVKHTSILNSECDIDDKSVLDDIITFNNSSIVIRDYAVAKRTINKKISTANSCINSSITDCPFVKPLPKYISDIVSKIAPNQDYKFYKKIVSPITSTNGSTCLPSDDSSFLLPSYEKVPVNCYKNLKVFDVPDDHQDVPDEVKDFMKKSGKKVKKLLLFREYPIHNSSVPKLVDKTPDSFIDHNDLDSDHNSDAYEEHDDDCNDYLSHEPLISMEENVVNTITLTDDNDDFSTIDAVKDQSSESKSNLRMELPRTEIYPTSVNDTLKTYDEKNVLYQRISKLPIKHLKTSSVLVPPESVREMDNLSSVSNSAVEMELSESIKEKSTSGNLLKKLNNLNDNHMAKAVPVPGGSGSSAVEINKSFEGCQTKRKIICFCKGNPYPSDIRCFSTESKINKLPEALRNLGRQILSLKMEMIKMRKARNRYRIEKERYKKRRTPIKFDDLLVELEKIMKPEAFQVILPSLQFSHKDLVGQGFRYSEELKRICAKILLSGGWKPYLYLSSFLSLPGRTTMTQYIHDQINLVKSAEPTVQSADLSISSLPKTDEILSSPEKDECHSAADVTLEPYVSLATNVLPSTSPIDQNSVLSGDISNSSQPNLTDRSQNLDTLLCHARDILSYGSVENVFVPKEITKKVQYVPPQKKGVRKKRDAKTKLSQSENNIKQIVRKQIIIPNNRSAYGTIKKSMDSILSKDKSNPISITNKRGFHEVFNDLLEDLNENIESDKELEINESENEHFKPSEPCEIANKDSLNNSNVNVTLIENQNKEALSNENNEETYVLEVYDNEVYMEPYSDEEMEVATYIELDS